MILLIFILIIAGLVIAIVETAKRHKPDISLGWLPFWASLPIPALLLLYGLYNFWWLQSAGCADIRICNSDGIAAMTRGVATGLFGSFFIGMTTAILWINWRNRK